MNGTLSVMVAILDVALIRSDCNDVIRGRKFVVVDVIVSMSHTLLPGIEDVSC